MEFGNRGHGGSQQDGAPEGGPSYHDPVDPLTCPYDLSLAGSSSHVPQSQGLGQMSPTHPHNPPFPFHNQYSSIPRCGHTQGLHQSSDGLQTSYPQAWTGHRVTNAQVTIGMPQPYTSQPYPQGDVSVVNRRRPSVPSPFHPINLQIGGVTRPMGHQQDGQHVDNRRPSCPQLYSPTPQQYNYLSILSPTRSSSSYSPSEAGSGHFEQISAQGVSSAWPHVPYDPRNRHTSNPTPSTRPHSAVEPQSHYPPFLPPSNQPPNPAPHAQVPLYLGTVPSDHRISAYPPDDAPSFPEPQLPSQTARGKRKRETQSSPEPEPQPSKRKRKRVPRFGEQPVASSSRVSPDTPSPQEPYPAARGKKRKSDDPAKEKDANRKKGDRKELGDLFCRIRDFLEIPEKSPQLQVLDRVINRFGGDPVPDTDKPMKSRQYPKKGLSNSVRANKAGGRFRAIRNTLMERGYRATCKTSRADVLRIVLYELMRLAGIMDPELTSLIHKFLPQDDSHGA